MRDRRLERVEAIIERKQRVPAESDNDRFLLHRENCRVRLFRPCRQISQRRSLLPFGDSLLIDPVPSGKRPQALLTTLYCSTDCLCRRGAPMQNLADSVSLHSVDMIAPSKSGIKHLGLPSSPRWYRGLRLLFLVYVVMK